MVIVLHSSDSTGTLVSLDERRPKLSYPLSEPPPSSSSAAVLNASDTESEDSSEYFRHDIPLYPTALFLPEDDVYDCEDDWCSPDDDDNDAKSESTSCYYSCTSEPRPLYLPLIPSSPSGSTTAASSSAPSSLMSVDSYLPLDVVEAAENLLAQPPRHFALTSRERVLYVSQGEIAHAVPLQCEVLMSDRATTCHILALHSTSDAGLPLATLAHLDDSCYDDCLKGAVQRHYEHHVTAATQKQQHKARSRLGRSSSSNNNNKPSISATVGEPAAAPPPLVCMDVHIVGGFADPTSSRISNWLLYSLATIAADYQGDIKFTLKTCAISSLNSSCRPPKHRNEEIGHCSSSDDSQQQPVPVGRGLALDVRLGRVYLARADANLIPAFELRSARLFHRSSSSSSRGGKTTKKKLACVHDQTSNDLIVEAFAYASPSNSHVLLSLEDELLLRCASTSPHCEESDFCSSLRSTLEFLRDVPPSSVFGKRINENAVYRRIGRSNQWKCLRGNHHTATMTALTAPHRLFGF